MSVAARMLENVEDNTQAATGDVIQLRTVDDDVAVCTFKHWFETPFCLCTGNIVKVSCEGCYEPSCLFVNRDVQHNLIYLLFYFFTFNNPQHIMPVNALVFQAIGHLMQEHDAQASGRPLIGRHREVC